MLNFRAWVCIAGVLGMLAVVFGAFAGHGLSHVLSEQALVTFKTGNQYHFYHVFALMLSVLLSDTLALNKHALSIAKVAFVSGIFLFSGSLYLLAMTGVKGFAYVTPVGGVVWIIAWSALALSGVLKKG